MILSVRVVLVDREIDDQTFRFLLGCVPNERREHVFRRKSKRSQDNTLAGIVLSEWMLLQAFGIPFQEQRVGYGIHGKPYLRGCPGAHFNISHSGPYVACAVSDRPVGVDIERITRYRPAVAKRVCTPDEIARIEASAGPDAEFTKIWTQKEAYLKLLGLGFSENSLELALSDHPKAQTGRVRDAFLSVQTDPDINVSGVGFF